jgi:hypothetical protein
MPAFNLQTKPNDHIHLTSLSIMFTSDYVTGIDFVYSDLSFVRTGFHSNLSVNVDLSNTNSRVYSIASTSSNNEMNALQMCLIDEITSNISCILAGNSYYDYGNLYSVLYTHHYNILGFTGDYNSDMTCIKTLGIYYNLTIDCTKANVCPLNDIHCQACKMCLNDNTSKKCPSSSATTNEMITNTG